MKYDYFYGMVTESFLFYRLPKIFFERDKFIDVSLEMVERKHQGLGKPNIIYVKNLIKEPMDKSVDNYVDKPVDRHFLKCKNYNSEM